MKRSVKKHAKKRRSPVKRRYRMNSQQRVTLKPVFGDNNEIVIDLPVDATVKDLKDRLNPDMNNQLFVPGLNDPTGENPIVLQDNQLVSMYGSYAHLYLLVSPKRFAIRSRMFGQHFGTHGPYDSKDEALRAVWLLSNDRIRDIRRNPVQPYKSEEHLNLRGVQIDDDFVPQTKAELDQRLEQIWASHAFSYNLISLPA
jgi:hypothetical protein